MAVNEAIVGKTYPPLEPYLVGREKVREFARAVQSSSGPNLDPDAAQASGFSDVVAPQSFY